MAAGKKSTAPKPLSDKAADAANPALAAVVAEEMGKVRPEGMPTLWPLHALPRRKRTEVKRGLGNTQARLVDLQKAMNEVRAGLSEDATDESLTPEQRTKALAIMTDMEDVATDALEVMATAAVDEDEFTAWADKTEDQVAFDAFAWYLRTLASGEATGSQTS